MERISVSSQCGGYEIKKQIRFQTKKLVRYALSCYLGSKVAKTDTERAVIENWRAYSERTLGLFMSKEKALEIELAYAEAADNASCWAPVEFAGEYGCTYTVVFNLNRFELAKLFDPVFKASVEEYRKVCQKREAQKERANRDKQELIDEIKTREAVAFLESQGYTVTKLGA